MKKFIVIIALMVSACGHSGYSIPVDTRIERAEFGWREALSRPTGYCAGSMCWSANNFPTPGEQ